MRADATVATTRPPKEPANKNEIIARRVTSSSPSAYRLRSNLTLIIRKLKATAAPITRKGVISTSNPLVQCCTIPNLR